MLLLWIWLGITSENPLHAIISEESLVLLYFFIFRFKRKTLIPTSSINLKILNNVGVCITSHEATKNFINACWNALLHKAPRKSVGHFWTGPNISHAVCLSKPCVRISRSLSLIDSVTNLSNTLSFFWQKKKNTVFLIEIYQIQVFQVNGKGDGGKTFPQQ